ncbi:unnamed protein product [Merluccius merluccius]
MCKPYIVQLAESHSKRPMQELAAEQSVKQHRTHGTRSTQSYPVSQFYSWKGKGLLSPTGELRGIHRMRGPGPESHSFSHLLSPTERPRCLKRFT